ncbi:hypothetical protein [Primorskyibacter sp. S187A]|uniref:hypothetical protein n=1 Tax=Primorskyibacter sp. S187A TaxID=3415130 RepID=UPI003C7E9DBA
MVSLRSSLRSGVKRTLFGTAAALHKRDPSGQSEARFWRKIIARMHNKPEQLQSLGWQAEEQGNLRLAFDVWAALSLTKSKLRGKGLRKLIRMERNIRLASLLQGDRVGQALTAFDMPLPPADDTEPVSGDLAQLQASVEAFWQGADRLEPPQQSRLCKACAALAAAENRAGRSTTAVFTLQPVLSCFPAYQTVYPQVYKALLEMLMNAYQTQAQTEPVWALLAQWDLFLETRAAHVGDATSDQLWQFALRYGHRLLDMDESDAAARLIAPLQERREDSAGALSLTARMAERRADWEAAARDWQLYAAIMNPVSTKSGTIKAQNAETRARQANVGRTGLRRVRVEQALDAHKAGQMRAFREMAVRIVESLPDQRLLKYDPRILEVARLYVQDALREEGLFTPSVGNAGLRRVVIAMDILKVSEVHTHSRVIFTMCRNLLLHDPGLEIHVVITHERFAVTTPVVAEAFDPTRDADVEERARAALGDLFGARFHLHSHLAPGLEGVAEVAQHILALTPDVVLYGGGHRGLFSNESRLVRHVLYDLLPAVFFYIQANNEVDPKFDMIITRGPHAVEGDPGRATIREQPYPTIVDAALSAAQQPVDPAKHESKTLVSAITGVRMDVRLSEMGAEEMAGFFSILDRVPGAVWHFIGCRDIKMVRAKNPEIARRMTEGQIVLHTVMPFEDFTDLVTQASLFLHLPGFTGGSGGAAVARRAAIPILTFNHSDVSGRQPPETVFETDNIAGFAEMAVGLLEDADAWVGIAERQIAHTNWIRETSVQGFHGCLSEAARLGRDRLAQALG